MKYCFFNKKIILEDKAKIGINDLGLLRGYAIFEYLRSYNGKPFLFDYHMDRFENSAKLAKLKIPYSRSKILEIIIKLIKINRMPDAGIRIVLTGGSSEDGITPQNEGNFFISLYNLHTLPMEIYQNGGVLITKENQRELFGAKTTNYINLMSCYDDKKEKNAIDVLYISRGKILECATSNFFIFKGDNLITAKENILLGTRRRLILNLVKGKFKISEREIILKDLLSADEAFISSTTREIVPIVKIDKIKIDNGKPGERTKFLMSEYGKITNSL
ncbi:MAG: amino acid aminotransferase [Candidatus Berkelbacteria bacterium]|nr:amino acid aminotransferase [Candidatus Berkelbacteria bacterium]